MVDLIGGVAVIEKENKHLLIQQTYDKSNGGKWRHPGGKFEPGETPQQGMVREVHEETGLGVLIKETPLLVLPSEYNNGYFGFFGATITGGELIIDPREIIDHGWYTKKEISQLELMNATAEFYKR